MNLKQKGKMSIFLACTIAVSLVPSSFCVSASCDENIIYENNFENGNAPDEVSGVITKDDVSVVALSEDNNALKFKAKFDGTDNLESNIHEFAFYKKYKDKISQGATLKFDLIIPTDKKQYDGLIKYTGKLGTHNISSDNKGWGSTSYGDINSNDFVDLGNGFSSKSVTLTLNDNVNVDMFKVNLQIVSYNCNYNGDIYIDNLKLTDKSSQNPVEMKLSNSDQGIDGWKYKGKWDYQGKADIKYDDRFFANGALKVSLDYLKDVTSSWSEVKLGKTFNKPLVLDSYNAFSYDLYYDPDSMSQGSFMTKLLISNAVESNSNIDFSKSEDIGNGLRKVTVKIKFNPKNVKTNSLSLSIIGAKTDYKGDIFIDNIKFLKEETENIYGNEDRDSNNVKKDFNLTNVLNEVDLSGLKTTNNKASLFDDFEGYGDEDSLLQKDWKANAGDGCSVTPRLIKDGTGNHDLEFNYKISTEKVSEGWVSITKKKNIDWSSYNSLQFWCAPDGKGQKLVIQISSNGEDFEANLSEFAGTTEEKLITIPFNEFKNNNGETLDLKNIEKVSICCNTIPKISYNTWNVDSKIYFDDIKAVYIYSDSEKAQLIKVVTDIMQNASNQKNDSYLDKAQDILNKLPTSLETNILKNRLNSIKSDIENFKKEQI